jgi:F-type H+-transporting ATPase subunit delta
MIDSSPAKKPRSASIDVGAQKVGTIYAKALLGAAEAQGKADAIVEELKGFVGVLESFPKLNDVLGSALVSHEEKGALLDRVFGQRLSPLLLDSLKVISRHGRLDIVPAISLEVRKLYDEMRGNVRVQVSTAAPLGDAAEKKLAASLKDLLKAQPLLEAAVEPELIGGIVLRVGDTVYDGSVARQLHQVREQMITRSVHEIQSRRDSFRHSGGN